MGQVWRGTGEIVAEVERTAGDGGQRSGSGEGEREERRDSRGGTGDSRAGDPGKRQREEEVV